MSFAAPGGIDHPTCRPSDSANLVAVAFAPDRAHAGDREEEHRSHGEEAMVADECVKRVDPLGFVQRLEGLWGVPVAARVVVDVAEAVERIEAARQAMRERGEQSRAEQRLEDKQMALEAFEDQLQNELTELEIDFEPSNLTLERLEVPLRKSDTTVDPISLVWLPWRLDPDGSVQPAY